MDKEIFLNIFWNKNCTVNDFHIYVRKNLNCLHVHHNIFFTHVYKASFSLRLIWFYSGEFYKKLKIQKTSSTQEITTLIKPIREHIFINRCGFVYKNIVLQTATCNFISLTHIQHTQRIHKNLFIASPTAQNKVDSKNGYSITTELDQS